MRKISFLLVCFFSLVQVQSQELYPYKIYKQNGKRVSYKKMLRKLEKQDIILFGELHNNPIAHWLQLKLVQELNNIRNVALGLEMIESDNQEALDQYLAGKIDQEGLDSLARLWPNYETDYKPVVDFAKHINLPVIATNIPRRYASLVYHHDFDTLTGLSNQEKEWIAPLPIPYNAELPSYKKMQTMMSSHPNLTFPKAQAIKDATMAYFIVDYFTKTTLDNPLFIHLNGSFHSDYKEGIAWYLNYYFPEYGAEENTKKLVTLSSVEQETIRKLSEEHKGKADFILVVDQEMTKTY